MFKAAGKTCICEVLMEEEVVLPSGLLLAGKRTINDVRLGMRKGKVVASNLQHDGIYLDDMIYYDELSGTPFEYGGKDYIKLEEVDIHGHV